MAMREILRTNEPVLLSYVEALFAEASVPVVVADRNMSMMEGSIGILPRRVLVPDDIWAKARAVLVEAGLEEHISDEA